MFWLIMSHDLDLNLYFKPFPEMRIRQQITAESESEDGAEPSDIKNKRGQFNENDLNKE